MRFPASLHWCSRRFSVLILAVAAYFPASFADWSYEVVEVGALVTHRVAFVRNEETQAEMEFFVGGDDPAVSLALFVPEHRFPLRETVKLKVQVDEKARWDLTASRHVMALVVSEVPDELLTAVSRGRQVRVFFPGLGEAGHESRFSLDGSASALLSLQKRAD